MKAKKVDHFNHKLHEMYLSQSNQQISRHGGETSLMCKQAPGTHQLQLAAFNRRSYIQQNATRNVTVHIKHM